MVHLTPATIVSTGVVGTVRGAPQPAHVSVWLRPDTVPKREHPDHQLMDVSLGK